MNNLGNINYMAVTANAMKSDLDKAKQQGFSAYITKPTVMNELLQAINHATK